MPEAVAATQNPGQAPAQSTQPPATQTPNSSGAIASEQTGNAVKDAAAEAVRRHKLKVDGQEIEVDEEELKRGYSHQRAANKILQEGKLAKKQAEEFISMMKDKQKLFDVLKKLGHDPKQLSEEYLGAMLEDEMMDPREKELKHAKSKLQQYADLEKKQKEAAEKRMNDSLKAKYAEEFTTKFVDALKTERLPPTKGMVAEMAKYISRAAKLNFEMTPAEAAKLVKEDIERSHQNLYGESDAETLARLLGEQGLQKIRTYDTSRLKDPNANLKTPMDQSEPNARARNSTKRMSPQEWRDFNRK